MASLGKDAANQAEAKGQAAGAKHAGAGMQKKEGSGERVQGGASGPSSKRQAVLDGGAPDKKARPMEAAAVQQATAAASQAKPPSCGPHYSMRRGRPMHLATVCLLT